MATAGEPVTIKRYGNRRLYEPGAARYVTKSDLQARMRHGICVMVRDAATGADITDHILTPRPTEH